MLIEICNLGEHPILTVISFPRHHCSTLILVGICRRVFIGTERLRYRIFQLKVTPSLHCTISNPIATSDIDINNIVCDNETRRRK